MTRTTKEQFIDFAGDEPEERVLDNRCTVDSGALRMALNVLRRAGKTEVADELEQSAARISVEATP